MDAEANINNSGGRADSGGGLMNFVFTMLRRSWMENTEVRLLILQLDVKVSCSEKGLRPEMETWKFLA